DAVHVEVAAPVLFQIEGHVGVGEQSEDLVPVGAARLLGEVEEGVVPLHLEGRAVDRAPGRRGDGLARPRVVLLGAELAEPGDQPRLTPRRFEDRVHDRGSTTCPLSAWYWVNISPT